MRALLALVLALAASLAAGGAVGMLLADIFRGDVGYVLVFFAIPVAAIVAGIANLVAWTSPVPRRALLRSCLALSAVAAAGFALLLLLTVLSDLPGWLFWREMQLHLTILVSVLTVVVVQWLVFRSVAAAGAPPPAMPEAPEQLGAQP